MCIWSNPEKAHERASSEKQSKLTKKQVCKLYPTITLRLSRSRRAAYGNKCFDHSIWSMFLHYFHIWNFKITGWKTSKTKELQNLASVWNNVLAEMFLLRNWQSFRVPPLQRAPCKVLGEAPSNVVTTSKASVNFAKVRCFNAMS